MEHAVAAAQLLPRRSPIWRGGPPAHEGQNTSQPLLIRLRKTGVVSGEWLAVSRWHGSARNKQIPLKSLALRIIHNSPNCWYRPAGWFGVQDDGLFTKESSKPLISYVCRIVQNLRYDPQVCTHVRHRIVVLDVLYIWTAVRRCYPDLGCIFLHRENTNEMTRIGGGHGASSRWTLVLVVVLVCARVTKHTVSLLWRTQKVKNVVFNWVG
jgi:hypothetical protein